MSKNAHTCHSLNCFEIAGNVLVTSADNIDGAQVTGEWLESNDGHVDVTEWV